MSLLSLLVTRDSLTLKNRDGDFLDADQADLVTNFASHDVLKTFLNQNSGFLSIQWVKLSPGDEIVEHTHSVDTMMIACKGRCQLTGLLQTTFREGDAVVIPKQTEHGLVADDEELFSGLTIRFRQDPF